jgi:hypothetical protein
MVVDAAVEDDRRRVVCAANDVRRGGDHRLRAAIAIDDREAPVHERDVDDGTVSAAGAIAESPTAIGAAMGDVRIEQVEPLARDRHPRRRYFAAT